MLFNSIDFLIFFPAVLLVYFIVPHRIRPTWMLLSSYYFYMSWNPWYGLLIGLITTVTYIAGRLMEPEEENKKRKKLTMLGSGIVSFSYRIFS